MFISFDIFKSLTRKYKDTRETFQIAKKIAQKKAKTVVTDGAFSYNKAVRKEFMTYKNPKPHKRCDKYEKQRMQ